jgi:hypothetical protein
MFRRFAFFLLLALLITTSQIDAQTETPIPTWTPTPEVFIHWELPTEEVEGTETPMPPQGWSSAIR